MKHLQALDGLRGAACLYVVLFHGWALTGYDKFPVLPLGSVQIPLYMLFFYGYSGVEMFFVLSGFCLAYPMLARPERPVEWGRYIQRRARRILPPYWIATLLFFCIGVALRQGGIEPFASVRFLQWEISWRTFFHCVTLISYSGVGAFWTLPLEWRWYFVLPIFALLIRKRIPAFALFLATIPISLLSLETVTRLPSVGYYLTAMPIYLPVFVAGVWAADMATREASGRGTLATWERFLAARAHYLFLASLGLIFAFAPHFEDYRRNVIVWTPIYFFLILAVTHHAGFERFFSHRGLVWLGTISYSLYLIHDPIIRASGLLLKDAHWSLAARAGLFYLILPALCIGVGYLFFLVAERPFLRKQ